MGVSVPIWDLTGNILRLLIDDCRCKSQSFLNPLSSLRPPRKHSLGKCRIAMESHLQTLLNSPTPLRLNDWKSKLDYVLDILRTKEIDEVSQSITEAIVRSAIHDESPHTVAIMEEIITALNDISGEHSRAVLEELGRRKALPRVIAHLLWQLDLDYAIKFLLTQHWIWHDLVVADDEGGILLVGTAEKVLKAAVDACGLCYSSLNQETLVASYDVQSTITHLRVFLMSLVSICQEDIIPAPDASFEWLEVGPISSSACITSDYCDMRKVALKSFHESVGDFALNIPELVSAISNRANLDTRIFFTYMELGRLLVWASMLSSAFLGNLSMFEETSIRWRRYCTANANVPPIDIHVFLTLTSVIDEENEGKASLEWRLRDAVCTLLCLPEHFFSTASKLLAGNESMLMNLRRSIASSVVMCQLYAPRAIADALLQSRSTTGLLSEERCWIGSTIDTIATALIPKGPLEMAQIDVHKWILDLLKSSEDSDAKSIGKLEARPHPGLVELLDNYIEACLPLRYAGLTRQQTSFTMMPLLPSEVNDIIAVTREWPQFDGKKCPEISSHSVCAVFSAMYFALRYMELASTALKPLPPPFDFSGTFRQLPLRLILTLLPEFDAEGQLSIRLARLIKMNWPDLASLSAKSSIRDRGWPPELVLETLSKDASRQTLLAKGWPLVMEMLPQMVTVEMCMSSETSKALSNAWHAIIDIHPAPHVMITCSMNLLLRPDLPLDWNALVYEPHLVLSLPTEILRRQCLLRILLTILNSLLASFGPAMGRLTEADNTRFSKDAKPASIRGISQSVDPEAFLLLLEDIIARGLLKLCSPVASQELLDLVGLWIGGRSHTNKILQTLVLQGLTFDDTIALIGLGFNFRKKVEEMLPRMLKDAQLHVNLAGVTTAAALKHSGGTNGITHDMITQCDKIVSGLSHVTDYHDSTTHLVIEDAKKCLLLLERSQ